MTGLFLEDRNASYLDDMDDRYAEVCGCCGRWREWAICGHPVTFPAHAAAAHT